MKSTVSHFAETANKNALRKRSIERSCDGEGAQRNGDKFYHDPNREYDREHRLTDRMLTGWPHRLFMDSFPGPQWTGTAKQQALQSLLLRLLTRKLAASSDMCFCKRCRPSRRWVHRRAPGRTTRDSSRDEPKCCCTGPNGTAGCQLWKHKKIYQEIGCVARHGSVAKCREWVDFNCDSIWEQLQI